MSKATLVFPPVVCALSFDEDPTIGSIFQSGPRSLVSLRISHEDGHSLAAIALVCSFDGYLCISPLYLFRDAMHADQNFLHISTVY